MAIVITPRTTRDISIGERAMPISVLAASKKLTSTLVRVIKIRTAQMNRKTKRAVFRLAFSCAWKKFTAAYKRKVS